MMMLASKTRCVAAGSLVDFTQDYAACKWPLDVSPEGSQLGSEAIAAWFDAANGSHLQQPGWTLMQQVLAAATAAGDAAGSGAGEAAAAAAAAATSAGKPAAAVSAGSRAGKPAAAAGVGSNAGKTVRESDGALAEESGCAGKVTQGLCV